MESKKKIQRQNMSNSIEVKESDIIITDPCYIVKRGDWGSIFDWEHYKISAPEFTEYIWTYTGQGDGSWMIVKLKEILNRAKTEEFVKGYEESLRNFNIGDINSIVNLSEYIKKQDYIGRFSVDSGTFGIFYLSEVLKYNPNFLRDHGIWLYTIIPEFMGSIQLQFKDNGFNIIGVGNKTFCSI